MNIDLKKRILAFNDLGILFNENFIAKNDKTFPEWDSILETKLKEAKSFNSWFTYKNLKLSLKNWSIQLKKRNLENWMSSYNIGNDKPEISIIEVLKIFKKMDKKLNYKKINYPKAYPADEPQRRCPDLSKARKQLNYNPKIKIDDGLKLFYDWAKENYKY